MDERVVWVTGVGIVSSLGMSLEDVWSGVLAGETGTGPFEDETAQAVGCTAAGQVKGFRASKMIKNRKSLKLMTRPVRLGVAAATLAWENAGLDLGAVDPERVGVFVGAGQAYADRREMEAALNKSRGEGTEVDLAQFGAEGIPLIHPLWLLRGLSNNVLGFVSLEYNAQGINNNYANSGVSAMQAIAAAADAVREGLADVSFAGGYDSGLQPETLVGFGRLGLLAGGDLDPTRAHKPFDGGRGGLVPAEGGCFLILESEEHARARGATPLARLSGGGVASDAYGVADPNPDGTKLTLAARAALTRAGISAGDIGAIFAHGTSSMRYDPVEITSYRAIFGDRLAEMPLTADKSSLGHTMSACGAMSAAVAARAIAAQVVPPIAALTEVDPACVGPRFVIGGPVEAQFEHALVSSAGLGGQAAALIVSRAHP